MQFKIAPGMLSSVFEKNAQTAAPMVIAATPIVVNLTTNA